MPELPPKEVVELYQVTRAKESTTVLRSSKDPASTQVLKATRAAWAIQEAKSVGDQRAARIAHARSPTQDLRGDETPQEKTQPKVKPDTTETTTEWNEKT